jgi:hypothetical protein
MFNRKQIIFKAKRTHSTVVCTGPCGLDTYLRSADTSRFSSGPVADTSRSSTLLCSAADTSRCSSGPCTVDTTRSSTFLCSADTSRCSSGPVADTSRSSTLLCSSDTSRCSSGPCSVDTSKSSTFLCSADTSRCSSGPCSLKIEAKQTLSLVRKFISKRSEHVYIQNLNIASKRSKFILNL